MRNIRPKTRTLDRPRFIREFWILNFWIMSNFSGDLCFQFCWNTLILAPECRKCILRGPNFQNFLVPLVEVVHSPPTPKILPPTQIPTEKPVSYLSNPPNSCWVVLDWIWKLGGINIQNRRLKFLMNQRYQWTNFMSLPTFPTMLCQYFELCLLF